MPILRMPASRFDRPFATAVALLAWAALILQYVLLIDATLGDIGPWYGTLRFFSFFTILSNLLVALVASAALAGEAAPVLGFFARPRARGCAALSISITCAIYYFVLAATWAPEGAQLLADVLLHYAVPVAYVTWWIACAAHGRLGWSDPLRWLLFPLAFLLWTLLRGAWLHEYPYPFIDVDALGMTTVLRNSVAIGGLFALAGIGFVAVDRFAPLRR